eukprot:TRINITY_DN2080_c0_g1_i1.p1 TRINITY_DN2080_c0_g1~~TRINITY_DN2080_c0_g1_i1.p1  ORF type:complete len:274 (+),score=98.03 TRINITY_DN2080_c0_g1_i1:78-824(+)
MSRVLALLAAVGAAAGKAVPQLPQQWSALQTDNLVISQGGQRQGDLICCELDAPQCKVQSTHQSSMYYFDGAHNRTRTGSAGMSGAIVSLYTVGKEMQVDENNTCTSYCPLQFDFAPFTIDAKAKYVGTTTVEGVTADQWTWTEYIFNKYHLLPMQKTNFYVTPDGAIPVKEQDIIEPLGQVIGTENQTWIEFKAGAPAKSLFDVKGVDSCPMDPNCQQDSRSSHRRRGRDVDNWAYYRFPQAFAHRQ